MDVEYLEPASVTDAAELLGRRPDARLLAGGTAVVLMMQQGLLRPEALVSLRRIEGLGSIDDRGDVVTIGSAVTLREVARSPIVQRSVPSLARSCALVGNVRVRSIATLGGNLAEADYASDPPAVLAGLDAAVIAQGRAGHRRIPAGALVTGFYETALAHDEVITGIEVRPLAATERAVYLKYVSRSSEDRPCVGVAARARFDGDIVEELSVVTGAVAPAPQRFPEAEALGVGARLDAAAIERVASAYAEAVSPLDDARGSAWYRTRMIRVFVRRALEALASPGGESL